MIKLRSVEEAALLGKRVVLRVDWNVTLGKALNIVDDTRIVRTLPTIQHLLAKGVVQIVILSHIGKAEEKRSIKPVTDYAAKLIGEEIVFSRSIEECRGNSARILMLENIRLWMGEDENEPGFAKELSSLGDIYVNEAFGESHRSSASIVGITDYLPAYAGLWLIEEVETIMKVREKAEHPLVVVMGGAKVEDKIKLIEILSQRADTILLGGKLANEYVAGKMSVVGKARILVPLEGSELLDIGHETQKLYANEIAKAKTIVWNGPMGFVEEEQYRTGTQAIFKAIAANEQAFSLVGGGDTLAAIGSEEQMNRIDHVSTGGGAMLKLLEKGNLPGIAVLQSSTE